MSYGCWWAITYTKYIKKIAKRKAFVKCQEMPKIYFRYTVEAVGIKLGTFINVVYIWYNSGSDCDPHNCFVMSFTALCINFARSSFHLSTEAGLKK